MVSPTPVGEWALPPARELSTLPDFEAAPEHREPEVELKIACEVVAPGDKHNQEQTDYCTFQIAQVYIPPYWSFGNISALGQNRHDRYIYGLLGESVDPSTIVPHLTWGGKDEGDIQKRLALYEDMGIERVIVSPPESRKRDSGYRSIGHKDPLSALPLMRVVKEVGNLGVGLTVYAEGHPHSGSRDSADDEFERIEDELRLADLIVTKPVFRTSPVTRLVKLLSQANIAAPVTPGILAFKELTPTQELAAQYNAKFYTKTLQEMIRNAEAKARKKSRKSTPEERVLANASALNNVGEKFTAQLGKKLVAAVGTDTLHLYTGNHTRTSIRTLVQLGVTDGRTF